MGEEGNHKGCEFGFKRLDDGFFCKFGEIFWELDTGFLCDDILGVLIGNAGEAFDAFFCGEGIAVLGDNFGVDAVGNNFAIDEDAVAIEYN